MSAPTQAPSVTESDEPTPAGVSGWVELDGNNVTTELGDRPTPEQADLEDVARRVLSDLTIPAAHVPLAIATLALGRPWLADLVAARHELADLRHMADTLRMRHRAVPVAEGEQRLVCAADRKAWPCEVAEVVWGQ